MKQTTNEHSKSLTVVVTDDKDNISILENGEMGIGMESDTGNGEKLSVTKKKEDGTVNSKKTAALNVAPKSGDRRRRSSGTAISAAALFKAQAIAQANAKKTIRKKKKSKKSNISGGAIFLAFLLALAAIVMAGILFYKLNNAEKQLLEITNKLTNKAEVIVQSLIKDCHYATQWQGTHGKMKVFPIVYPKGVDVFCDQHTDGGGWTVFQRRINGSENFYRTWTSYVQGFGSLDGEFWLGLERMHQFTVKTDHEYELRIDMEDFKGKKVYAQYSSFYVGDSTSRYVLHVGGYSGTAGDSMKYQNKMRFSTNDLDNDKAGKQNCAITHGGAWWYNACHSSNLNGRYKHGRHSSYADGVNWRAWRGDNYSIKFTEMKMRRKLQ